MLADICYPRCSWRDLSYIRRIQEVFLCLPQMQNITYASFTTEITGEYVPFPDSTSAARLLRADRLVHCHPLNSRGVLSESHLFIDIDDKLPTYPDGTLMCMSTGSKSALWPSLVEKAVRSSNLLSCA